MKTTTATAEMTAAQAERQAHRGAGGKYLANPCDLCGKGCKLNAYFSDDRCNSNGGWGVTLHEKCAAKLEPLTNEEYAAFADIVFAVRAAW